MSKQITFASVLGHQSDLWSTEKQSWDSVPINQHSEEWQRWHLQTPENRNQKVHWQDPKLVGHFQVHLSLHFKARLSAKSSLWKSVFIHIEIRTNYQNKNFALRLALKKRQRGTRKWPILFIRLSTCNLRQVLVAKHQILVTNIILNVAGRKKKKNMTAGQLFSLDLIRYHLDFGNWISGNSFSLQLKDIHRTKKWGVSWQS